MRSLSGSGRHARAGLRVLSVVRGASARCALAAAILSLVFCTLCAPPSKFAPAPEPSVTLEGEVALAGAGPLDRTLVLADAGGSVCALSSPRFEYELRSLAGHRVRVTGRVTGKTAGGPEFLVESYELALAGGRAPVMGTLDLRDADLVLVDSRSGVEYALAGPLADALRAFTGFKVWVDGPVTPFERKNGAGGTIAVEGYGILAPPEGANAAPSVDATPARP
jgi:hypothetical protein